MDWLQIRAFGPYPSSILPHSHCYEAAIEPKSGLKRSNFRFSLYSQQPPRPGKNAHLPRSPSPASTTYLPVRLIPRGCGRLASGHFFSARGP
ncbi:hypothetical protein B5V00_02100 [Geothermobacter hydrogeniphilus]|uniref:Uncharacterized protein n=1 Tax=Geothermobacter hydrogeniphilus TaxID=1969733 RepID=A0A1X0YCD1_9BACT|nr:hypothetical protein B5V00_02100 [Geothermobacter hydrogeniphilus]